MNREEALSLVKQHVKNENSIKHMLATEAIMRALARHFNEDENVWGLAGLLHDIDMEIVDYRANPEKQGAVAAEMLEKMGVDTVITNAIRAHNDATGKKAETLIEKAIFATDPLTGLIVASTLVLPGKKLADLTPENILNRFKEKSFAKGARREAIATCSEISLTLEEFAKIGLEAMKSISDELGL
ncbi:MAG: HDIG domain-containing protein [bacterium]|nr:HDIG domain-containing protein [bacterium]